jgi:hypothetical protein
MQEAHRIVSEAEVSTKYCIPDSLRVSGKLDQASSVPRKDTCYPCMEATDWVGYKLGGASGLIWACGERHQWLSIYYMTFPLWEA